MKMKMLVASLVTWRIVGYSFVPCQKDEKPNPYSGFCGQAIDLTRSATFQTGKSADEWAKALKDAKVDGAKISDVHVYSEEGDR
jgi:hypothetical protein